MFNIGDVVHLKGGGPDMTIVALEGGLFKCKWFMAGKLEQGVFPPDALER